MVKVRIWDWPTRLFHWGLVLAIIGMVVTGQTGQMVWHFRLGQAVLALLLFRLIWGLVGGHWSRFARFAIAPSAVLAYWRGQREGGPGHSPAGALATLGLLSWLVLQVLSGMMADDEIAFAGPLTAMVPSDWVHRMTAWHKGPGKLVLLGLVLLHLGAIIWYARRKGQRLTPAMLHGDKHLPAPVPASADGPVQWLLALLVLGASVAAVRWVFALGGY